MHIDNLSFWGIFFLVAGVALLIRVVFNIDFPVLKVLAGSFLIILGFRIIFGDLHIWPLNSGKNEFFFKSSNLSAGSEPSGSYRLLFSNTRFDLTGLLLSGNTQNIKIVSIFSGTTILIDPDLPLDVRVDAVFAGVKFPGRNTPVFGRGVYHSPDLNREKPYVDITASVVFGNIVVMYGDYAGN